MKWYKTDKPNQSELVQKLCAAGKGCDIMKAVEDEQRNGTGIGQHKGITVRRIGRIYN